MSDKAPNLAKIIAMDVLTVGRLPLLLMLTLLVSAMGVVFVTHQSRTAITDKDVTLVERERLGNEWRNLLLEETALAEHSRVEQLAIRELEMKRPDADKEVLVSLK
ncbi:cell division protein FtsL [Vibrio astriarenae]|uniref:Cell division protein FtsL n=1 Tax=Vibrio astriarenae TaxID=1481923 RepID=A0A7Z2T1H0_9VIBR|nr:cell division protein FtsL [Vibrio astriarenae]QIA62515.1 cell division protein FtsL [Vibrio astriarenae]GAL13038.1 cell division protein FtsL [Vibrio sp. C7]